MNVKRDDEQNNKTIMKSLQRILVETILRCKQQY